MQKFVGSKNRLNYYPAVSDNKESCLILEVLKACWAASNRFFPEGFTMNVSCKSCNSSYDLPDSRLPKGRVVSFPCPSCKQKITIDLREPEDSEAENDGANRLIYTPLDSSHEAELSIDDLKRKIINKVKDLPPMPKVLFKAREVMSDPKSGFKEIAKVIEADQAIAARILKVANSAYYGLSGMVNSIHQAAVVLGYQTLEQVITMVSSSSLLGKQLKGYGLSAGTLWRHSLAVAIGSRLLANKRAPSLEGDAFSVGLIHDVGKLALDVYIVQKNKEFQDFLKNQNPSFLEAERHILGFDHTEVAFDLCQKWKLPDTHAKAMRFHHSPELCDNPLAHIVHLANFLAKQSGLGSGPAFDQEALNEATIESLNLKPEDMEAISSEMVSAVEAITASLNG
jgi:HD-like signal output (HDOD) protein